MVATPLRGKDGKFAGSIGNGKLVPPKTFPKIPTLKPVKPHRDEVVTQIIDMTKGGYQRVKNDYANAVVTKTLTKELTTRYEKVLKFREEDLPLTATGRVGHTIATNHKLNLEDLLRREPNLTSEERRWLTEDLQEIKTTLEKADVMIALAEPTTEPTSEELIRISRLGNTSDASLLNVWKAGHPLDGPNDYPTPEALERLYNLGNEEPGTGLVAVYRGRPPASSRNPVTD